MVELQVPLRLRAEPARDDPGLQTLFVGPLALTVRDPQTDELALHLPEAIGSVRELQVDRDGSYAVGGTRLMPLHIGTTDPYHLYVRRTASTQQG